MNSYAGERELDALKSGIASRQPLCQEAYDAYLFDLRVEASQFSKFAFVSHEGRPVWARAIIVFPEDGGPARQGSFCVSFREGTTAVEEAFAFYGKAGERTYFGSLPEEHEAAPEEDDFSQPGWRM